MRELRLAVAMNGGVSLAVWIGGVAHELARFAAAKDGWAGIVGDRPVSIDVLAGTSAGGINAAFLALAQRYGLDLGPLRELWLDQAGLEPAPGAPDGEAHLLRSPRAGTTSLLDGELFHDRLRAAFAQLLAEAAHEPPPPAGRKRIDLRLTTTAYRGVLTPLDDDLDGSLPERDHRASFHFVDGASASAVRPERDLTFADAGERTRLADQLARAARSTASFPFAFDPSCATANEAAPLRPTEARDDLLLDGGVLVNLPVDEAIDAIFSMPADHPVDRWLVAVVPDPSVLPPDAAGTTPAQPTVTDIVLASGIGIPRNQTVGSFVADLRTQNAVAIARAASRRALFERQLPAVTAAAATVWPSYRASRRVAVARRLATELRGPSFEQILTVIDEPGPDVAPPLLPPTWDDPHGAWEPAVIRRHVALLLQVHAAAGADPDLRRAIHDLRAYADAAGPQSPTAAPDGTGDWRTIVLDDLRAWPEARGAPTDAVERTRATLAGLVTSAARLLVRIAEGWTDRPPLLDAVVAPGSGEERTLVARRLLAAIEVLRGAFADVDTETDAEQVVDLGLLTPLRRVALDPRQRMTAREKVAGDELGHFGAFLKRSWRANDWMWGRLDASSFLAAVLAEQGHPVPAGAVEAVQAAIVREEAPHVVAAVLADRRSGAASPFGEALVGTADLGPAPSWEEVRDSLGLGTGQPEREFLGRCRIGEEDVGQELWTPLIARVGTRATATTLTVARAAGLPLRSVLDKVLLPLRWIAVGAHRLAQIVYRRR